MGLEVVMLIETSQPHKEKYPLLLSQAGLGWRLLGVAGDRGREDKHG